jgi:predicted nucleic acid-binding protein
VLSHPRAPLPVQRWIAAPPVWLEIHDTAGLPEISGLDEGETAAIALAESLRADMMLIDERDGFRAAVKRGLRATGTLGLLDIAADRGLIDFTLAIKKLEQTMFRRPEALLEALLKKHKRFAEE